MGKAFQSPVGQGGWNEVSAPHRGGSITSGSCWEVLQLGAKYPPQENQEG